MPNLAMLFQMRDKIHEFLLDVGVMLQIRAVM